MTVLALAGLWRAFRTDPASAAPFAIALLCFPLIYYVTHAEDYYRRPIDPIFVILAVYAVVQWREGRRFNQTSEVLEEEAVLVEA